MTFSLSQVSVRQAIGSDRDTLFILAQELSTSFEVERNAFDKAFSKLVKAPDAFIAVAAEGSQLIGYLMGFDHETFYANGRVGWIEEVIVSADWRSRGVGRLLMRSFEEWAESRQTKLIALATRRASAFYKSLGYEESATYFRKLL